MAVGALESLTDPLLGPMLALLKDGITADMLALTVEAGAEDTRAAVKTTVARPFVLGVEGEDVLPALHCHRIRSRSSQFSAVYVDHIATLQFMYVTPACSQELLEPRWALLDRVWRSMLRTLRRGSHPAHAFGADVLDDAGVVRINLLTAVKREAFVEQGEYTFPAFVAEMDVTWRDGTEVDQGPLFPALSFDTQIFVNTDGDTTGTPDVVARSVTDAGQDEGGTVFPRPDDWSL